MTILKKYCRDHDEIEALLKEVEKSFEIKFDKHELIHTKTFGELFDIIISKINLPNVNDSTHQQAFYKLREAISAIKGIDKKEILPETELKKLYPRKGRKKAIKELEYTLGFNLKVLRPFLFIEFILIFSLLGSLAFLFYNFIFGIEALALTFIFNTVAFRTGKEFNAETVGDLAKKITKEKYKKSRRNPETINEKEVIEQVKLIFSKDFLVEEDGEGLEREEIGRETEIF